MGLLHSFSASSEAGWLFIYGETPVAGGQQLPVRGQLTCRLAVGRPPPVAGAI